MIRISLSSLAVAAMLAIAAVTPASSETLKNDSQPTACDCSNCSAQHCQGGGVGRESLHYRITLKEA
jgi:hypothetical protein